MITYFRTSPVRPDQLPDHSGADATARVGLSAPALVHPGVLEPRTGPRGGAGSDDARPRGASKTAAGVVAMRLN